MAVIKERTPEELAGDFYTATVALDALKAAFGSSVSDFVKKITEATDKASELRVSFQQAFGIFEEKRGRDLVKNLVDFNKEIQDLEIPTGKLAANFQLVGQNLETYVINKSDDSIKNFAKLVSVNEKLGITTTDTVKVINYLATGFGRSGEEIDKFSGKLVQFSRETGQEFKKVFGDFNQNIDKFYTILDPEKAGTQFMAFQQLARGFGSSIDRLMNTAEKFDSIESGVQFGTQLNNVLSAVGGSFDSMLVSTLSYDDRIKYIIKQIADSRQNIMAMDEISRRAFIRQLEQTSQLGGKTIQAILMNQDLVNNMEKVIAPEEREMTKDGGGIAPANVEAIAQSFTKTQDRLQLFLNEYARIGSRLEHVASEQAKYVRNIQRNTLGRVATKVTQARSSKALRDELREAGEYVKKLDEKKAAQELRESVRNIQAETNRMKQELKESLSAPEKKVLTETPRPTRPEMTKAPESPGGMAGAIESSSIILRNAIEAGIKAGVSASAPKEVPVKITIEATDAAKAYFKISASTSGAITGRNNGY